VCHCGSMCCGVHGRIADGVRAARTVGRHRRLFHGRPRTGRAGGVFLALPERRSRTCSAVWPPGGPRVFPGRGRPGRRVRFLLSWWSRSVTLAAGRLSRNVIDSTGRRTESARNA
jgi:hypothetical protein